MVLFQRTYDARANFSMLACRNVQTRVSRVAFVTGRNYHACRPDSGSVVRPTPYYVNRRMLKNGTVHGRISTQAPVLYARILAPFGPLSLLRAVLHIRGTVSIRRERRSRRGEREREMGLEYVGPRARAEPITKSASRTHASFLTSRRGCLTSGRFIPFILW